MQLHTYLVADEAAFNFTPASYARLRATNPNLELVVHAGLETLLSALPEIELLDTWRFDVDWYQHAPKLKHLFTPAAGHDWVHADPANLVKVWRGQFHGPMIAETLLSLMLHFNRDMPAMQALQQQHRWDRNRQQHSRLLSRQSALILGYGAIGKVCASYLGRLGVEVFAYQRRLSAGVDADSGARHVGPETLAKHLASADHVILLLPGGQATQGFMNRTLLGQLKAGACLYNFGRGTTLLEADLLWALDNTAIKGAGIDVTEKEPLPDDSPLWDHPKLVLLPHSSCIYADYQALHIDELEAVLQTLIT